MCACRPRGAAGQEWEFIESPTDEGIQPDIHPGQIRHSFSSNPPVTSSLGTFNLGGVATGNGGSLQDVRRNKDRENGDIGRERKASSASNLRGPGMCSDLSLHSDCNFDLCVPLQMLLLAVFERSPGTVRVCLRSPVLSSLADLWPCIPWLYRKPIVAAPSTTEGSTVVCLSCPHQHWLSIGVWAAGARSEVPTLHHIQPNTNVSRVLSRDRVQSPPQPTPPSLSVLGGVWREQGMESPYLAASDAS